MRSKARGRAVRYYFENAAHRISGFISLVDDDFHALLGFGVDAIQKNVVLLTELDKLLPCGATVQALRTDSDHVAQNADSEFVQKRFGERADGDARRRLSRAGAFQTPRKMPHEIPVASCRTVTGPFLVNRARTCRAASASDWHWLGRCCCNRQF